MHFKKGLAALEGSLRTEFLKSNSADLYQKLQGGVSAQIEKFWQSARLEVIGLMNAGASRVSSEMWGQLEYSMRSDLASFLNTQELTSSSTMSKSNFGGVSERSGSVVDYQFGGLRNSFLLQQALRARTNQYCWQGCSPFSLLLFKFARQSWTTLNWQQSHISEMQLWMTLSNAFSWSFYEEACFICARPNNVQIKNDLPEKLDPARFFCFK